MVTRTGCDLGAERSFLQIPRLLGALIAVLWVCAAAGCAAATPGEVCPGATTQCAGGLVCDRWTARNDLPYRCLLECERRSDCPGESICQGGQSWDRVRARGVCDSWGELQQGESCSSEPEDLCGPGLTCNDSRGGARCVPGCDAFSPHSEDRRCPAGWVCNETGSVFAPDSNRVCLRLCDVVTREGCALFETCLQIQHPELGVVGICTLPSLYGCAECPADEVCADGMCFEPLLAPPLPWPTSSEIPPLID
jgi:hypothetical protein